MLNYHELKMNALDDLKSRLNQWTINTDEEVADTINDVVENWIPLYNHQILKIAASHSGLVCFKSDFWPAYWQDYPINRIISNLYEQLREDLYSEYQNLI